MHEHYGELLTLIELAQSTANAASARKTFVATDVFINAATGDDNDAGLTVDTAWKTNRRLDAAIGTYGYVQSPTGLLTIHYVGAAPPASDPVTIQAIGIGDLAILLDYSALVTTVRSGSITALFRAINSTTSTANGLTDAAVVSWSSDIGHGRRLRMTSGVANGAFAGVAKDEGANVARLGPFNVLTQSAIYFVTAPPPGNPAQGDTYVIEQLPAAYIGVIDVLSTGAESPNFDNTAVNVVNAYLAAEVPAVDSVGLISGSGLSVFYTACNMQGPFFPGDTQFAQSCFGCVIEHGVYAQYAKIAMNACLFLGGDVVASTGSSLVLDGDSLAQGFGCITINGGVLSIGRAAAFDAAISFLNPGGDGFSCGADSADPGAVGVGVSLSTTSSIRYGAAALYGSGNAGAGVRVGAGLSVRIAANTVACPTVTGTAGDFKLGTALTSFTFDPVTATYVAPAVANTWANMRGAGLAGNAHAPQFGAHLFCG